MRELKTVLLGLVMILPGGITAHGRPVRVSSRHIMVSVHKTLHLVFPSIVTYVDLGSEWIISSTAPGLDNVVRVKASVEGFEHETSMAVFLKDGTIYDFSISYQEDLAVTTLLLEPEPDVPLRQVADVLRLDGAREVPKATVKKDSEQKIRSLISGRTGKSAPSRAPSLTGGTQDVLRKVTRYVHDGSRPRGHIASSGAYRLKASLRAVYDFREYLLLDMEIENESNLSMRLQRPRVVVRSRHQIRRSAISERELEVLENCGFQNQVGAKARIRMVMAIPQVSPSLKEKMEIEIREDGMLQGRSLTLSLLRSDLEHVRSLKLEEP